MRPVLLLLMAASGAWAQQTTEPPKATEQSKPVEEAKPAAEEAAAPVAEPGFRGSVEFGYRWTSPVSGSFDTWRSIVDYGDGPRLVNLDLGATSDSKWLHRFDMRASGWGGEPYNFLRIEAFRANAYRLVANYRDMAFFNAMPSFANPGLERGIFFNQRSYDIRRRATDLDLDLRPGKTIIPYLGWTHDVGFGRGVSSYVSQANEYPVTTDLRDSTDHLRGGVRIEVSRFHLSLEQGGTLFKDDQRLFTSDRNLGNRTTPFFGQTLLLEDLQQAYGIRGHSTYSRGLIAARPAEWIDVQGMFVYTRLDNDSNLVSGARGLFAQQNPVAFNSVEQFALRRAALQPHTRASAGFELRPVSRVRIVESWLIDRMRTASIDRLNFSFNQQQIEGLVDVTQWLTFRAGHRYNWGDSETRAPSLFPAATPNGLGQGQLRRHTGLAGFVARARGIATLSGDIEIARGDRAYFRTSLLDYTRARLQLRMQPLPTLSATLRGSVLLNQNPAAIGSFDYEMWDHGASLAWTPGKRFRLSGDYAFMDIDSTITYLVPQSLEREISHYRELGHATSATAEFLLPGVSFAAGGAMYRSTGSRATRFYQPMARVSLPVHRRLAFNVEWRWFGMNEPAYIYENFRGHSAVFSIRVSQ